MNFKRLLWLLILLIHSIFASAAIELTQPIENAYNIGDKISIYLSLIPEQDLEGFLKVILTCEDKQLPFYITPIKLISKQHIEEKIPDLTISRHILGKCKITIALVSNDGVIKEDKVIEHIIITNKLNLSFGKFGKYLPEQEIVFEGTLKDMSGKDVKNASLVLNFNDGDYDAAVKNGAFKYPIKAPANIRSGEHYITAIAEDQFGNKADTLVQLIIIPKPTSLDVSVNKYTFLPGEDIEITLKLVDQNRQQINDAPKLNIKNPRGIDIFSDDVSGNIKFSYHLDQYAIPGAYVIRAEKEDVSGYKIINVSKVEKLSVTLEGNQLLIKNVGNIKYDDKANIAVESEGKNYIIIKKLRLIPGEVIELDLSKEVPEGSYDIKLATEGFDVTYKDAANTEIKEISSAEIEDKRPLYKKLLHGLVGITGGVVGIKEGITAPFYLLLFLIIILLIVIYLNKKYFTSYKMLEEKPIKSDVSKMLDTTLGKKK